MGVHIIFNEFGFKLELTNQTAYGIATLLGSNNVLNTNETIKKNWSIKAEPGMKEITEVLELFGDGFDNDAVRYRNGRGDGDRYIEKWRRRFKNMNEGDGVDKVLRIDPEARIFNKKHHGNLGEEWIENEEKSYYSLRIDSRGRLKKALRKKFENDENIMEISTYRIGDPIRV